ncbi:uncharacterized protein TNCV_1040111 [Trichonephila clavipes]|nr:uncharacterized protein TNCV_1040111 [Trichonephila clavipes]
MASLGHQSLSPSNLGRVDEEMASPSGGLSHCLTEMEGWGIIPLRQKNKEKISDYPEVTPELQRRMRTGIWQLMPKERDRAQHQTCLVNSLQLPVRQFQGRPCTYA